MKTLKEIRASKNVTQAVIADRFMTEATLANIESGKHWPKPSTRRKIELMVGSIDWVGTRLQGLSRLPESDGVLFAMSEYVFESTSAPAKDKIEFLKRAINIMEKQS